MRVGIDLLWVRPGKNGGTESYIRNILDGLLKYASSQSKYYLYVSEDNAVSFKQYYKSSVFVKRICKIKTENQLKRVLWENMHIDRLGRKDKLDVWFMPVYSKPLLTTQKVPYVTVIHDIQALHYPEYFSWVRRVFFYICWKRDIKSSSQIVTISNFCRNDMIKYLKVAPERICVVYNPIITSDSRYDFSKLKDKYSIEDNEYFYTVSAIAKHKNIITLLKMMKNLREAGCRKKMLVTGVKVNADSEIKRYIQVHHLSDSVIFTGYICDAERDCLYDHCQVFLFPSVFEGFGMPPIEALQRGVPVVTTRKSSIFEVTQGRAVYVENPFDENEWLERIQKLDKNERKKYVFPEYDLNVIIRQYEKIFRTQCVKENR